MLPTARIFHFALLLIVGLGACQRASYSFLPVAGASYLAPAKVPTIVAASSPQLPADSARPAPAARRPHRLQRLVAAVASRPQAAARTQAATLPRLLAARPQPRATGRPASPVADRPVRQRSKSIALLLLVGGFVLLGPVGLHNFYLGRPELGVLGIVGFCTCAFLVLVGILGTMDGAATVGAIGLAALTAWQITDLVRILTGKLKPRNGEYYPRFFQLRPDQPVAATTAPGKDGH